MDTLISIDPKPIYLFTPDEVKTMLWRIFKGGADKIDYIGPDKKNNLRFEVTLNNYDDQELDLDSETYKTLEMLEDMGELDSHFYRGKFYITFNKSDMERKAMSTMNEKAGKEVITEGKAETAIIDYLNNHPGATSKDIILAVYGRDSDQLKGSSLLMAPIRAIARAIQVGSVTKDDSQRPSKYFAKSATTVQPKLTKPLVKLAGEFAVLDLLKQRGTQGATAKDFMPFFKSLIHSVPTLQKLLKSGEVVRDNSQRPALWYLKGNQPGTADISLKPKVARGGVVKEKDKDKLKDAIKNILRNDSRFRFNEDSDVDVEFYRGQFHVDIPTTSRGPRTDHGGEDNEDDWMSNEQIRRAAAPYEKIYAPYLKKLRDALKPFGFKVTWAGLDYGEKGHVAIQLTIGDKVVQENKDYTSGYPFPDKNAQSYVMLQLAIGQSKFHEPGVNTLAQLSETDEDAMVRTGVKVIDGTMTESQYVDKLFAIYKKMFGNKLVIIGKNKDMEDYMRIQIELRLKGNKSSVTNTNLK